MANEVDESGERTIGSVDKSNQFLLFDIYRLHCQSSVISCISGVLTKVDLVDKGAEKEIVKIMMNPDAYKVPLLILVTSLNILAY